MKRGNFTGWLTINLSFFLAAFLAIAILKLLFPAMVFQLWEGWIYIIKLSLGGSVSQLFLKESSFLHILARNSLSVIIVFIGGLSLIAPLIMALCGCFYALNLLCVNWSPKIFPYVALLVLIESAFFLLTASFSSALAGEAFHVKPDYRSLLRYWKRLKPLKHPEKKPDWRRIFRLNREAFNLYLVAVVGLLLAGGLLEAWILLAFSR
ncbi:hypothetical protein DRO53_03105 [Candidatus Bathyarchaeota archaeon]|nr:MAG: hypothetical protein DRO46_00895 [Candidatus Hecatellales archaeon]RLI34647.1 MAG: hypothetical protein DRO53_03105 [Candidatus Bathyarchaeota archaeon]